MTIEFISRGAINYYQNGCIGGVHRYIPGARNIIVYVFTHP